jgi:hypothetical protein
MPGRAALVQVEEEKVQKELQREEQRQLEEEAFDAKKEQWILEKVKEDEAEKARVQKLIDDGDEEYTKELANRGVRCVLCSPHN